MFSKNREKGSLTLETALILPLFFFMFMFIIGYFGVISARNTISHALIQATTSLSLDSYANESFERLGYNEEDGITLWNSIADIAADLIRGTPDPYFANKDRWYKSNSNTDVVKKRFIGYLVGSDGDATDKANKKLKSLGVENGLNGMSFEYAVVEGDLKITVKYKINSYFNFFGLGSTSVEQSTMAKMWKYDKTNK